MPSFAQTLPIVLLVVASAFAAPAYVPGEADPQALSVFKRNKMACSNDKYSDKCDMDVVRRYNVLELALSKRLSVFKPTAPVESDDAHAEHVGKNATSPSAAHVSNCSPSFEGAGLRVVESFGSLQFGPSAANAQAPVISSSFRGDYSVDWHFEQTDQSVVDYIIKDVGNNKLAVRYARGQDVSIILDKASNAPDQIWTVQCDTCSTGISGIHGKKVASQCIIRPHARKGGCVAVGPNPDSLAYVTNSAGCTKFDFFTN